METEEEEESNETGNDKGGGRRCECNLGEEAELTHKSGRRFISGESASRESSASYISIQTTEP